MRCLVCGGEIQATEKRYFTLVDGAFEAVLDSDWEFYCENDHPVEDTAQFIELESTPVIG